MSIRIVNLRNYVPIDGEVLIKVDRTTVVGNPFYLQFEEQRGEVCDKYETYFYKQLNNTAFRHYLKDILGTAKNHNVALGCWCYPKRCHAETIKRFVEKYL